LSALSSEIQDLIFDFTNLISAESAGKLISESNGSEKKKHIPFMSHQEALAVRLELMKERSNHNVMMDEKFEETWNFCEH